MEVARSPLDVRRRPSERRHAAIDIKSVGPADKGVYAMDRVSPPTGTRAGTPSTMTKRFTGLRGTFPIIHAPWRYLEQIQKGTLFQRNGGLR